MSHGFEIANAISKIKIGKSLDFPNPCDNFHLSVIIVNCLDFCLGFQIWCSLL